ncbi:MAG: oligoribonuclease [Candidatus Comchoanobacterales bacterium]
MWLWVDLEMTGLDSAQDVILEVAAIKTDQDLNIIGDVFEAVVHQSDSVLDNMNEWCQDQHQKSGLVDRVKQSNYTIEQVEEHLLTWLGDDSHDIILCGNSIHTDRRFIDRYMPRLAERLHYRMIDVTSIKLCVEAWQPKNVSGFKSSDHRALSDIKASIDELKHYKSLFLS